MTLAIFTKAELKATPAKRISKPKTKAKIIYISNVMTKFGETNDFEATDFIKTVSNYLGKDVLDYVVDDTHAKQGKIYPGNHLPIVSRTHLHEAPPHYLLLLAWNFVDELVKNTSDFHAQGGRYIVPIPSLRVI